MTNWLNCAICINVKVRNEYKLEFDVATHKFDASYRYDNYTKSGISPVSELMSWYEEIKEKYGK